MADGIVVLDDVSNEIGKEVEIWPNFHHLEPSAEDADCNLDRKEQENDKN